MEHEQKIKLSRGAIAQIRREAKRTAKELPYMVFTEEHAEAISKLDNQTAGKIIKELCFWIFDENHEPSNLADSELALLVEMKAVQDRYFIEWQKFRAKLPAKDRMIHLPEVKKYLDRGCKKFRVIGK